MTAKKPGKFPPIDLGLNDWAVEAMFVSGDNGWYQKTLWDAAKDLPIHEVPLVAMDMSHAPWDGLGDSYLEFCKHVALVQKADLTYPIILFPDGTLADGRHRLAKAIAAGHTHIKMVRLPVEPEPDCVFTEDGECQEL